MTPEFESELRALTETNRDRALRPLSRDYSPANEARAPRFGAYRGAR